MCSNSDLGLDHLNTLPQNASTAGPSHKGQICKHIQHQSISLVMLGRFSKKAWLPKNSYWGKCKGFYKLTRLFSCNFTVWTCQFRLCKVMSTHRRSKEERKVLKVSHGHTALMCWDPTVLSLVSTLDRFLPEWPGTWNHCWLEGRFPFRVVTAQGNQISVLTFTYTEGDERH